MSNGSGLGSPIKHVVVVMLENRSYDNVLGWLYNPSNAAPFDTAPPGQSGLQGLAGSETNPNPDPGGKPIQVGNAATTQLGGSGQVYSGTAIPIIDPNEPFADMAQQFLSLPTYPVSAPYDGYNPDASGLMQGFTTNYARALGDIKDADAMLNLPDIMNYLTPAQLPVTAFLANNFAVCDQWFASVPTQTFTNRVFAFCAAPAIIDEHGDNERTQFSIVNDEDYPFGPESLLPESNVLELPTICSQLDLVLGGGFPNWKVYFHDYSISVMTVPYIANAAQSESNVNVSTFDNSDWGGDRPKQLAATTTTFVDDVANGTLPAFSFIEPRYSVNFAPNHLPPNNNHPGVVDFGIFHSEHADPSDPPIDATGGELLLMQVYNLLRNSTSWDSTLLIITYDEHGGTYDHVPPPLATPPGTVNIGDPPMAVPTADVPNQLVSSHDTASIGFNYTLFGGRVPAIIVSPYIGAGTTVGTNGQTFDHSSIVKTVWNLFNLSASPSTVTSLTARDLAAPGVDASLGTTGSNNPPAFSGTIVASPSFVTMSGTRILHHAKPQTVLVSAGPGIALTVTSSEESGPSTGWLSVTTAAGTPGANITVITVSVATHWDTPSGTYSGKIVVSGGDGVTTVTIPVTLYLSL
jgi:phospholipase C